MLSNTSDVKAWKRHASNLFYSESKFELKINVTPSVLIIYQKQLFKLVPKSITNFLRSTNFQKWQKLPQNHVFLFLCSLTQGALVLN